MDKKWNLQDIRPSEPRKRRVVRDESDLERRPPERMVSDSDDGTMRVAIENGTSKKRSNLVLALIVFFTVLGGGVLFSLFTGGADVTVFPKHREPNINATFEAFRTPRVGELSYEIMTLEADGERQVSATGQENVTEQATGMITIYNNTDSTERLIKNTRFEAKDGLIFKITESVVVPKAGTDSTGKRIPGSIQAEVFSDGTGEKYNITPQKLTVPGYKENNYTELYENIYAENNVTFSGGFDGPKFIIDENELETAKQQLQTELRNALLDRIDSEKPAGFVVFDEAVAVTFQSLPPVQYGENLVTIKEKALLQIPIFKDSDFATYLAAATIPGYENETVRIDDVSTLTFSYANATSANSNIANFDSIEFDLQGKPQVIWTYDEGKLKTDLLGAQKTALPTILGGYPAIEKAEAVVRPFWKRSFPDELDSIDIIEVVGSEE